MALHSWMNIGDGSATQSRKSMQPGCPIPCNGTRWQMVSKTCFHPTMAEKIQPARHSARWYRARRAEEGGRIPSRKLRKSGLAWKRHTGSIGFSHYLHWRQKSHFDQYQESRAENKMCELEQRLLLRFSREWNVEKAKQVEFSRWDRGDKSSTGDWLFQRNLLKAWMMIPMDFPAVVEKQWAWSKANQGVNTILMCAKIGVHVGGNCCINCLRRALFTGYGVRAVFRCRRVEDHVVSHGKIANRFTGTGSVVWCSHAGGGWEGWHGGMIKTGPDLKDPSKVQ